jgi:Tol biopolymer transport system component
LITPEGEQISLSGANLPSLSQTLFQTNIWESPDYLIYRTQSTTIALWDIKNENLVWESEKDHYIDTSEFVWSPDGKYVAFLGSPLEGNNSGLLEVFILSTEGQLYQKTEFNEFFDDYNLLAFKWSLDSDKLLFILQDNENVTNNGWSGYQYHLLMLDLSSDSIYRFCVSGYDAIEPWSPDSSTIAFIGTVDNQSKLMFLNVDNGDVLIAPYDICTSGNCEPSDEFGLTGVLGWIPK